MSIAHLTVLVAAAEDHAAAPSPLEFNADLALFTLVIFISLLFVLGFFGWKPLLGALERRERSIADSIESARQAQQAAENTLRQYEQKLAAAADEAARLVNVARQDAASARDRILADAAAEAQQQRERAVADIQAAKNEALRELAERSVDTAVALAGQLIGSEVDRGRHTHLMDQALRQFTARN